MSRVEVLRAQRDITGKQAAMQKLFVKGHLLVGADTSATHINDFLLGLGEVCGMNIFDGPHVKTPDHYDLETYRRLGNKPPDDINGSVMWDDSGAQMYIFPNRGNWFTLDVYTCKEFDYGKALLYAYEQLGMREDMMFSTQTAEINTPWREFVLPSGRILNPESKYLPEIDQLFDKDYSDPDEVVNDGLLLRGIVIEAIREGCGARVAQSYTPEQVKESQAVHSRFEITIDHRFIDDVLSGKATNPDQYLLQPTYNRLSFMEATVAGMESGKPVMHIGTGWPGTAIGLYRQFGIPVTCVEKDPEFAQKSKEGLDRLNLLGRDKLQVICADGTNLNTDGHGVVIISAMVSNEDKMKIIENMRQLAWGDVSDPLLILRTPADRGRRIFYQELSDKILSNQCLTLVSDTTPHVMSDDPLKSLVFKVREMSAVRRGEDYIRLSAERRLQTVGNFVA